MFLIARNFQLKALPRTIVRCLEVSKSLGLAASVGIGSFFLFTLPAAAVETIELRFQDRSVTVSLEDIREFAETGEATTALDAFIEGSEEIADIVGNVLTEEITLSPAFQQRIRNDIQGSSLGQFLLTQINQFIQGSTELTALENAIQASLAENNRLSILEIAENYTSPDVDQVTINLTEAGVIYRDVRSFVERVLPAIDVAREFLQDAICDCPTVTEATDPATDPATTPQSSYPGFVPVSVRTSQINCEPTAMPAQVTAEPVVADSVVESIATPLNEPMNKHN
jgi:hypothetical protein